MHTATAGVAGEGFSSQQCLGRSRWQTTGSITDTSAQRTTFIPVRALCVSQKCVGRKRRFRSRKACLSTPHLWLPESDFLSPTCSHCYLDRCCIYVFTWYFYDIYTYFLGIWRLKFTVKHVALVQTGYRSVTRSLLSTLATGQGETVAGREVVFRV